MWSWPSSQSFTYTLDACAFSTPIVPLNAKAQFVASHCPRIAASKVGGVRRSKPHVEVHGFLKVLGGGYGAGFGLAPGAAMMTEGKLC
jgi:hypothetical protein